MAELQPPSPWKAAGKALLSGAATFLLGPIVPSIAYGIKAVQSYRAKGSSDDAERKMHDKEFKHNALMCIGSIAATAVGVATGTLPIMGAIMAVGAVVREYTSYKHACEAKQVSNQERNNAITKEKETERKVNVKHEQNPTVATQFTHVFNQDASKNNRKKSISSLGC